MCAHHEKEPDLHQYHHLTTVAWAILVMGLSLAVIIILWIWFGHIGPTFSEDILTEQQKTLRKQYGLPAEEAVTNPAELQVPPSLRNLEDNTTDTTANTT